MSVAVAEPKRAKPGRKPRPAPVPKPEYVPWSVESAVPPTESLLLPRHGEAEFAYIAGSPKHQEAERIICELDPWYWRVNYVVTQDEHWASKGLLGPYQRWPAVRHHQAYVEQLWRHTHTFWIKSRQQMITWLVATQILGDALFTGGRLYMVQSKREADSKKVLHRIRGVWKRMRGMAPWLGPDLVKDDAGELGFSNDSSIMAVPAGAHYVQSHTPAWWVGDEVQLQDPDIEEAYYQALPACERVTLIATPDYGWACQRLLTDRLSE